MTGKHIKGIKKAISTHKNVVFISITQSGKYPHVNMKVNGKNRYLKVSSTPKCVEFAVNCFAGDLNKILRGTY